MAEVRINGHAARGQEGQLDTQNQLAISSPAER